MKYLDVYYDYLRQMDKIKKELGQKLGEKEDINQRDIIYTKANISKLKNIFIIVCCLMMILTGPVYNMVKEYFNLYAMWYYVIFIALVCGIFLILYLHFKAKLKALSIKQVNNEESDLLSIYKRNSEKIYEITIFLICINKYYYDLVSLKGEKLKDKWEEVSSLEKEAINSSMNYHINIQSYQEYLEEWIVKNK